MIVTIEIGTNSIDLSVRFWTAMCPDAVVRRPDGRGRMTVAFPEGTAMRFTEATVTEAITTVDMTVYTDEGAPQRLRDAGFEVAVDGSRAVDVNATDSTIRMVHSRV